MNVRIEEVKTRRQLSAFIHFPYKLYKGNDYWVPALIGDEYDTFNPKKNAAYPYNNIGFLLKINKQPNSPLTICIKNR